MDSIIILVIALIAILLCSAAVIITIYCSSKNNKRRNDIHISGGADIETGQISSDNNFFKGLSGTLEETWVAESNLRAKNKSALKITIRNLRNSSSEQVIVSDRLIIGRADGEGIYTVRDDASVSKNHCILFISGGDLYISDLNSANHTYLNKKLIINSEKCHCNDVIRIGNTYLQILF